MIKNLRNITKNLDQDLIKEITDLDLDLISGITVIDRDLDHIREITLKEDLDLIKEMIEIVRILMIIDIIEIKIEIKIKSK